MRNEILIWIAGAFVLMLSTTATAQSPGQDGSLAQQAEIQEMKREMEMLRNQLEIQRQRYEKQIRSITRKLDALENRVVAPPRPSGEDELSAALDGATVREPRAMADTRQPSRVLDALQRMNPDISVIGDIHYHNSETDDLSEIMESMAGFGHSHGGGHGHEHGAIEEGFNIREVELWLSGEVDPYFKAYTTIGFSEEGAELEEIVAQTTCLPAGFQLSFGRFLSHFGRINSQHPHEWDFVDRPLIYSLAFGDHGLLEKGVQLSWLAPTPFHLLLGVEALQGNNERTFNHIGGEHLPDHDGPRIWLGWLKFSPVLSQRHGLQFGLFGGTGVHQEAHLDDDHEHEEAEGEDDHEEPHVGTDHYLDGDSYFGGADLVYKYDSGQAYGHGDMVVQAEYFFRKKELDILFHESNPGIIGKGRDDKQDGYYIQALYGVLPRWRLGGRWEQAGVTNDIDLPNGVSLDFDESHRWTGMLDFTPTEFSRLRFQFSQGDYVLEDRTADFWQIYFQLLVSIGTHGAHKF